MWCRDEDAFKSGTRQHWGDTLPQMMSPSITVFHCGHRHLPIQQTSPNPISSGKRPHLLSSNHTAGHSGQTTYFLFHMTTEFSSRRFFSLSMWWAAKFSQALRCVVWSKSFCLARQYRSPCWCKTHLIVDTYTCLPVTSNSLWTCFLVFFSWLSWPIFPQQQVIACFFFLTVAVTLLCLVLSTHSCLYSWSWDLQLFWNGSKWLSSLVQINNVLFQINAELSTFTL